MTLGGRVRGSGTIIHPCSLLYTYSTKIHAQQALSHTLRISTRTSRFARVWALYGACTIAQNNQTTPRTKHAGASYKKKRGPGGAIAVCVTYHYFVLFTPESPCGESQGIAPTNSSPLTEVTFLCANYRWVEGLNTSFVWIACPHNVRSKSTCIPTNRHSFLDFTLRSLPRAPPTEELNTAVPCEFDFSPDPFSCPSCIMLQVSVCFSWCLPSRQTSCTGTVGENPSKRG